MSRHVVASVAGTLAGVVLVVAMAVSLAEAVTAGDQTAPANGADLAIPSDPAAFVSNPALLERILQSPHGYLRFTNRQFSNAVCRRFTDALNMIPNVNLQGDAHLEQYAVTDRGRGLTDFDDASTGPPVLDLVRFGVSIRLACEMNGWTSSADTILTAFLDGYRRALEEPELTLPPPELVNRMRSRFQRTHIEALAFADSVMVAIDIGSDRFVRSARQLAGIMQATYPDLSEFFFEVKRAGTNHMGIGSALDEKYLLRVEGPTLADEDDVILEAKEVRDLSEIECLLPSRVGDPFRVLTAQARLSHRPYEYVGYIVVHPKLGGSREKTFWVHSWVDNYVEISVSESFDSPDDIAVVARDVGAQLGNGHPRVLADPFEAGLRRHLIAVLDTLEGELRETIDALTVETIAAWEAFRTAVATESIAGGD